MRFLFDSKIERREAGGIFEGFNSDLDKDKA
jgi:hypothetical protein